MIKVTVFYGNEEGKSFNMDYYVNTHMPLVQERLTPFGMRYYNVEKGISDTDPSAPPMYVAVGYLLFNDVDGVHEGFKTHGRELVGDVKNFTDIEPKFLISELVA